MIIPKKINGYRAEVINAIIDCLSGLEKTDAPSPGRFAVKLPADAIAPSPYMVPAIKEWRLNGSNQEVTPSGSEDAFNDAVPALSKNPLVPTWAYDACPEDFGIKSVSGAVVTLYGGEITIGTTGYLVGDTALTVTTDTAYLGWDFSFETSTLTIANFGPAFLRDPAHLRKRLYRFKKYSVTVGETTVERVALVRRGRLSDIYPANMG